MKVSVESIKNATTALLMSLGAEEAEAKLVAENLAKAELRGISTHGINFLPMIVERIEKGLLDVPTKVTVVSEREATAHLDGGNGLGQVVATEAMRRSITNARKYGTGVTVVRNTNHVGLLAFYTLMAASEGMIGICMCNSAPAMAPWGGAEPFFGTNPFSVACPSGSSRPVVLDMSTSVVARGKIRRAARLDQRIAPNWALDSNGSPTDDPQAALKGTLLPIGGAKGYGLAFFVDLLSGLLSGSKYSRAVSTFHQPIEPTGVGVMTMAIDITRFMPLDTFEKLVREHAGSIRESVRAEGVERIYLPGEIEAELEERSEGQSVEVDDAVGDLIEKLLRERHIGFSLGGDTPADQTSDPKLKERSR